MTATDAVLIEDEDQLQAYRNTSLNAQLKIYFENQPIVGKRQFATKVNMSRQRLETILGGAPISPREEDRIRAVFSEIVTLFDKKRRIQEKNSKKS